MDYLTGNAENRHWRLTFIDETESTALGIPFTSLENQLNSHSRIEQYRKELEGYTHIRPKRSHPQIPSRRKPVRPSTAPQTLVSPKLVQAAKDEDWTVELPLTLPDMS